MSVDRGWGDVERAPADPVLWIGMAVGFALRALLLARYPHLRGIGDEPLHYATGVLASVHGPAVFGHWAPGYDALLAVCFWLLGPDPLWPKMVQVLLSTGTIGLVYGVARDAGGRLSGRIAASLCAVDPTLVAYSHYLFSETLFLFLLVAAARVLFRREALTARRCVAGGLLLGLATLTRSTVFYFLIFAPIAAAFAGRRRCAQAATVLAAALLVVLPWTVRNAVKYRGFVLVDGTAGLTAYFAFSETLYNQDLGFGGDSKLRLPSRRPCEARPAPGAPPLPAPRELARYFPQGAHGLFREGRGALEPPRRARELATVDVVERERCEVSRALAFAREHPATVARHALERIHSLWGPNSFLLRWIWLDVYREGPFARSSYPSVKWLVVALHVGVVAGAVLCLGRAPLPPVVIWSALFAAYITALHMAAVAYSRYRLPLVPFLMVAAGVWLAHPVVPRGWRRRAGIGLALIAFAGLSAHYATLSLP